MEKENSKERKEPRMLPYNMEAEQSLLGCLFLSQDACMDVFALVKVDDFYSNAHKKIYEAMLDNYKKDVAIDYITTIEVLSQKGQLEDVGGASYITDLTNYVPSSANYKYYADIVRNTSMLREIIGVGQSIMTSAYNGNSAVDVLKEAEKQIFDVAQTRRTSDLVHIKSSLNEAVSLMEQVSADPNANSGVKVGFPTLDRYTNGFKDGELIILAARPGIGKTAMAVNFAVNAAIKHNKSVAIFDLEMSSMQVAQRLLSSTGRIDLNYMKTGT
ncbi:MAG: replicative DNA helicase, partial [Clostridia bacterium]|nr:replicative DNA helicase [Clostridia bacterium]